MTNIPPKPEQKKQIFQISFLVEEALVILYVQTTSENVDKIITWLNNYPEPELVYKVTYSDIQSDNMPTNVVEIAPAQAIGRVAILGAILTTIFQQHCTKDDFERIIEKFNKTNSFEIGTGLLDPSLTRHINNLFATDDLTQFSRNKQKAQSLIQLLAWVDNQIRQEVFPNLRTFLGELSTENLNSFNSLTFWGNKPHQTIINQFLADIITTTLFLLVA